MRKNKWLLILFVFCLAVVPAYGAGLEERIAWVMDLSDREIHWTESVDHLGTFSWSRQEGATLDTFAKELDLTGTAEPGTFIYYGIVLQEKGELNLWEKHRVEVGFSGLVQESIVLPRVGQQYLVVFAENGDILYGHYYTVDRREEALEGELENFWLNLYEVCSS